MRLGALQDRMIAAGLSIESLAYDDDARGLRINYTTPPTTAQATLAAQIAAEWPIAEVRGTKRAAVNAKRALLMHDTVLWDGDIWQADAQSRENLLEAIINLLVARSLSAAELTVLGITVPATITWRTAADKNRDLTFVQLFALSAKMGALKQSVYLASWQIKAAIEAAADPRTVDTDAGWPP